MWPFAIALPVVGFAHARRHLGLAFEFGLLGGLSIISSKRSLPDALRLVLHRSVMRDDTLVSNELATAQVLHPAQTLARTLRPVERRRRHRQLLLDLVQQGERILRLAVHLVDEGDDRNVAQAAHFEQLQRLRLDALGGVEHHDGESAAVSVR
jgi:hypothetical protein